MRPLKTTGTVGTKTATASFAMQKAGAGPTVTTPACKTWIAMATGSIFPVTDRFGSHIKLSIGHPIRLGTGYGSLITAGRGSLMNPGDGRPITMAAGSFMGLHGTGTQVRCTSLIGQSMLLRMSSLSALGMDLAPVSDSARLAGCPV